MRLKALLATILMLAVLFTPLALAEDTDAYHMVITYTDMEYGVGDDVAITVHVFDKAQYVSVDYVNMTVGSFTDTRDVELNEDGTGRWTGTFTIQEGDIGDIGLYRHVPISAEADVNGSIVEDVEQSILIPVAEVVPEILFISTSLTPPSVYTGPGETKTITWEIRYDDQLVDPTTIEGSWYVHSGSSTESFDPVKSSTGVYTYEYTMPNGPKSMQVAINLDATYDTGTDTVEGESNMNLFLNYLHVWAEKGSVSATTASFDLYVSNMIGMAVEAASITIDYSYEGDDGNTIEKDTTGTTDADGRASIDIQFNDLGDQASEVDIEGRVVGQGKEQALEFELRIRLEVDEPPDPVPNGLDVISGKDMFDFDKDVNLPATAYFDGDIHASSTVYWYAYTQHSVLNKGEKNTKVDGTFSVDFRTPDKGTLDPAPLITHYQTPIEDGAYYHDDTEILMVTSITDMVEPDNPYDTLRQFKDSAVKVSVDKLEKGKDIPVTVTYNRADEEWVVAVIVGNDPNPGNLGLVPSWTYWSTSLMTGAYGDMCDYDGSKWTTSIFLPENLPNKDFYVGGLCVNPNLFLSSIVSGNLATDYIKTNYVDGLEIGQSGSSGGNGGDSIFDRLMEEFLFGIPLLYWIFILVIIVILGIVVGLMTTRKREPRELEDQGLEPTGEGPTFEGGLGAAVMPMPEASYDQMQPVAAQADYGAPAPVAPAQLEYAAPVDPYYGAAAYETQQPAPAPAPYPDYGAPLPPAVAPAPEYAAPPPPEYAAPPPPGYAAPPPPVAPAQPEYAAPAVPPPATAPLAPPYAEAPPVAPPPAAAPPAPAPFPPQVPPPTPEVPSQAPPPAAAPAPAAPAAAASATMTIRCQKCQTTLTIPRKRPIKVTCPNCGASGVLR